MTNQVAIAAGTKIFIGGATDTLVTENGWTEIGDITNYGEFGKTFQLITHSPVGERRTWKFKGSYDEGGLNITFGQNPYSVGQSRLRSARNSDYSYNFKIVFNDSDGTGQQIQQELCTTHPTSGAHFTLTTGWTHTTGGYYTHATGSGNTGALSLALTGLEVKKDYTIAVKLAGPSASGTVVKGNVTAALTTATNERGTKTMISGTYYLQFTAAAETDILTLTPSTSYNGRLDSVVVTAGAPSEWKFKGLVMGVNCNIGSVNNVVQGSAQIQVTELSETYAY